MRVNDARGLRASCLSDAETGRCDEDCDWHSWLQQHSRENRNRRNEGLEMKTHRWKGGEGESSLLLPFAETRRWGLYTGMLRTIQVGAGEREKGLGQEIKKHTRREPGDMWS